jgi:predicted enzyme related to lactoylglutathione lyase
VSDADPPVAPGTVCALTPPFLIELPADSPERARRFWEELLQTRLESRRPEEGRGWQAEHNGILFGLHERGSGPGDRFSLPYFPVPDLAAALEQVRALGGEIIHPGDRWAICRDSEGTPFGLTGSPQAEPPS